MTKSRAITFCIFVLYVVFGLQQLGCSDMHTPRHLQGDTGWVPVSKTGAHSTAALNTSTGVIVRVGSEALVFVLCEHYDERSGEFVVLGSCQ
mgnify:CR=1 FL=1